MIAKIFLLFLLCVLSVAGLQAQKFYATRNGQISFVATNDDDVSAVNNEVASRITSNGNLTFSLLIKSFFFQYAEMQDHFNSDYLQSNTYPRADFKGAITNIQSVNFSKNGKYPVTAHGNLTLHGVTKAITVPGTIEVAGNKIIAKAKFTLLLSDFNIHADRIAKKVAIQFNCTYQ
ncbi:YceI family protein [Hydrotalea sp.]|uniref:YceI family protein n=2 Tax=Hydrotalea sp. TaxID=2881279 RepID=UPI0026322165|nr:YceI family protein [Hydrotalea sp.]